MIRGNARKILSELPRHVMLVAAAKSRTPDEILQAIDAGVENIGENYLNDAQTAYKVIGNKAQWHFIGHLQKNKIKKAIRIFDIIETVDSFELALEIDKQCGKENKLMPILIEINSAREQQKSGVLPENAEALVKQVSDLKNVKIMGLMTMGAYEGDPEDSRRYFVAAKIIFDRIKALNLPNVKMQYLSMGMSGSYKVAISEGANIVRIGAKIFGERRDDNVDS